MNKKVFISAVSALTLLSATNVLAGNGAGDKAQYKADKETCRYLVNQRKQAIRDKSELPQKTIKTAIAVSEDKTSSIKQNVSSSDVPERTVNRAEHYDDSNVVVKAMKSNQQKASVKAETFNYKLVSECMKDKGHA
jgi:hypothetical protein